MLVFYTYLPTIKNFNREKWAIRYEIGKMSQYYLECIGKCYIFAP